MQSTGQVPPQRQQHPYSLSSQTFQVLDYLDRVSGSICAIIPNVGCQYFRYVVIFTRIQYSLTSYISVCKGLQALSSSGSRSSFIVSFTSLRFEPK